MWSACETNGQLQGIAAAALWTAERFETEKKKPASHLSVFQTHGHY